MPGDRIKRRDGRIVLDGYRQHLPVLGHHCRASLASVEVVSRSAIAQIVVERQPGAVLDAPTGGDSRGYVVLVGARIVVGHDVDVLVEVGADSLGAALVGNGDLEVGDDQVDEGSIEVVSLVVSEDFLDGVVIWIPNSSPKAYFNWQRLIAK